MTEQDYKDFYEHFKTARGKRILNIIRKIQPVKSFLDPNAPDGEVMIYRAVHLDGQRFHMERIEQLYAEGERRASAKKVKRKNKRKATTSNVPTESEGDVFI